MAKITCARLDERGIFQGMVEVEEAHLDLLHLSQIRSCDHAPGTVRWQWDTENPYGGAFVPLPKAQRAKAGRPTLEHAVAFEFLSRWETGAPLTEVALAWLDDALQTVDFASVKSLESVQRYAAARGLFAEKREV